MNIDLNATAYQMSSELFSFKDMRRGVIEHGRVCFIEGYKQHAELFYSFLTKYGYFSNEELEKVLADFESEINGTPALTIGYVRELFNKFNTELFEKERDLYPSQKDIIELYKELSYDTHIMIIQKPRKKGISTVLSLIAYIEAMNGKRVLYYGYDHEKYTHPNITYKHIIHSKCLKFPSDGPKYYDLIIVDEASILDDPIENLMELDKRIPDSDGKMIVAVNPPNDRFRENFKPLMDICNTLHSPLSRSTIYKVEPNDADKTKANKHPQYRNEYLGEFYES